jgi:hypothetical protein
MKQFKKKETFKIIKEVINVLKYRNQIVKISKIWFNIINFYVVTAK